MADPMRLPPMHTVERDNYEAEQRRRRNRRCEVIVEAKLCGNKTFAGTDKCAWCTYPERMAAMNRPRPVNPNWKPKL